MNVFFIFISGAFGAARCASTFWLLDALLAVHSVAAISSLIGSGSRLALSKEAATEPAMLLAEGEGSGAFRSLLLLGVEQLIPRPMLPGKGDISDVGDVGVDPSAVGCKV
jgi:hypothetical protein